MRADTYVRFGRPLTAVNTPDLLCCRPVCSDFPIGRTKKAVQRIWRIVRSVLVLQGWRRACECNSRRGRLSETHHRDDHDDPSSNHLDLCIRFTHICSYIFLIFILKNCLLITIFDKQSNWGGSYTIVGPTS